MISWCLDLLSLICNIFEKNETIKPILGIMDKKIKTGGSVKPKIVKKRWMACLKDIYQNFKIHI